MFYALYSSNGWESVNLYGLKYYGKQNFILLVMPTIDIFMSIYLFNNYPPTLCRGAKGKNVSHRDRLLMIRDAILPKYRNILSVPNFIDIRLLFYSFLRKRITNVHPSGQPCILRNFCIYNLVTLKYSNQRRK